MKALRALRQPYAAVVSWALALGALAGVVGLSLSAITHVHERRQWEQRICEAEWRALTARNPYLARYGVPADPCIRLQMVTAR